MALEIDSPEALTELQGALASAKPVVNDTPPASAGSPPPPEPPVPSSNPPAPATPPAPAAGDNKNTPPPLAEPKPGTPPAPAAGEKPAATVPAPAATDENTVELENIFGGKYSSIEQIETDLNRIPQLEAQLKEALENPQFKSPRAKMLFDYANRFEGSELQAFQQQLHIQSLPLDTLSDQQKRFEAFRLDPSMQGLTDEEVRSLFTEDDFQKFGDPTNTETPPTQAQIIRAKVATNEAQAKLSKMQQDFKDAKPAPTQTQSAEEAAAELTRLNESATQALTGFKGIQLPVTATGDNGEKLDGVFNFSIDKPEQLRLIQEGMVNPQKMWEAVLVKEGIVDQAGNVDMKKFGMLAAEFLFRKEMVRQSYIQGHNDRNAYTVKNLRNPALPPAAGAPPGEAPPKSEKEGLGEAAYKAIRG